MWSNFYCWSIGLTSICCSYILGVTLMFVGDEVGVDLG
jgi:hypothetical protein